MDIKHIDVTATIKQAKALLKKEKQISPALRTVMDILLMVLEVLLQRFNLNSKNSSKPPSSDPNRKKTSKQKNTSNRKPGGQPGRIGKQLKPVDNPDEIKEIKIDKRSLPKGDYTEAGYEARQVVDILVSANITEYRAQVLMNSAGNRYVAPFPDFVKRPIQYGPGMKASSVYQSQYQLIPYHRVEDYFKDQAGIPISPGSLFNFNQEAYRRLEDFEQIAKDKLIHSHCLHTDETGININGKRLWLHTACNDKWTHFYAHAKRGSEAMDEIGIIPNFQGVLCHDHWKPYYKYACLHALCNAHHLRELEWSAVEDTQPWAAKLKQFLLDLNVKVDNEDGKLSELECAKVREQYRAILAKGQIECPAPKEKPKGQRGRIKKSKSRNLLERFIRYENDVLRFMTDELVSFTNNQGENDLRMTKVQQKISGCFRSMEGAYIFCRIRAYLITCRKHDVDATEALELLFEGKLPDFVDSS